MCLYFKFWRKVEVSSAIIRTFPSIVNGGNISSFWFLLVFRSGMVRKKINSNKILPINARALFDTTNKSLLEPIRFDYFDDVG